MNKKGQSALEYLMTYGWALIVIAIVVGLLVFILSTTTGGSVCQSTNTQFIIKESAVSSGNADIVVQNATGRQIGFNSATGDGDFSGVTFTIEDTAGTSIVDATLSRGKQFVLNGNTGPGAGEYTNGIITIDYNTTVLNELDFNVVCSGSV